VVRETEGMEGFKGHVQIVDNDGVAGRIDRRLPLLFLLAFFYVRQRICITMGSTDCVTAFRSTLPRPRLEQALYSDILMQCRLGLRHPAATSPEGCARRSSNASASRRRRLRSRAPAMRARVAAIESGCCHQKRFPQPIRRTTVPSSSSMPKARRTVLRATSGALVLLP